LNDNITPDILTDQTSAHDPLYGYIPNGISLDEAIKLRETNPTIYKKKSLKSMARHVGFMLEMQKRGSVTFDYGNNLREFARQGGEEHAFDYDGFVPKFIRPLFCDGKGPFRWVALSGDPEDIYTTDHALMELFPENVHLITWLKEAQKKVTFQGLPSRICWLGMGEREKAGLLFNQLVKEGKVKAPIVIGFTQSGDGRNVRRKRCCFRLATFESHGKYRWWCHLGFVPSWRRCWHRLFATCRHGYSG
jgi:urocanate hydratase